MCQTPEGTETMVLTLYSIQSSPLRDQTWKCDTKWNFVKKNLKNNFQTMLENINIFSSLN